MKQITCALAAMGIAALVSADAMAGNPFASPEAIQELRERAATGDLPAMYRLGYALQNDEDRSNDLEGRDLMIEAANRGYWISAAQLGQHYLYGWAEWSRSGLDGNVPEAMRWLKRAAEVAPADEDVSDTYRILGDLYSHTFMRQVDFMAAPLDEAEAIRWYRLCAAGGNEWCAGDLGRLLVKDPATATEGIKWLLNAANRGNGWAMRDLAGFYADGKILRPNLVAAVAWYRRAAAWTPAVSEGNDLVQDVSAKAEALAKQLTPQEIQQADEMVTQFKPKSSQ